MGYIIINQQKEGCKMIPSLRTHQEYIQFVKYCFQFYLTFYRNTIINSEFYHNRFIKKLSIRFFYGSFDRGFLNLKN